MNYLLLLIIIKFLTTPQERKFGSLHFFFFSLWAIFLCGVLYCLQSWALSYLTGSMSYLMQPAIGYSGVLFAYIFIECHHATVQSRSFFGFFSVPSKLYPWIILVVMQFVMPNISFVGHLSGILVGYMAVYGVMDLLMPSYEFCATCEVSPYCFNIYKFSNFVVAVDCGLKTSPSSDDRDQGVLARLCGGLKWVVVTAWHFISTLLFIFGCPVDACTASASRWHARAVNYVNSFTNANRNVFETDSIIADQQLHQLDRLEAGRGSGGSNNNGGVDSSNRSNGSSNNGRSREELEAHRKSARDARLQKFSKPSNINSSHSPSTRRSRENSPTSTRTNRSSTSRSNTSGGSSSGSKNDGTGGGGSKGLDGGV